MEKELSLETLDKIERGAIIAKGIVTNSQETGDKNIFMVDSDIGRNLMWVAVKGYGYNDWCIYIHWADSGENYVLGSGDKVFGEGNIRKLLPCTDEVFNLYRK